MNADLVKIVEEILEESMKQIEFLITHADKINELSNNALNLKNIDSFRSGITIVYMANQNKGILSRTPLDVIFNLLDKGVLNETQLDSQVYIMNLKKEVV
jgi:hypothetical protein